MLIKYDFHIHSACSPCALEEMSPNNIVNMALINELDVIAITDHNTCENVKVIAELGNKKSLLVIPGMEIETREEIHVLCFFMHIEDVYNMQSIVYKNLHNIKNQDKIFGEQLIFDDKDEVTGKVDKLLSFATNLTINEVFKLASDLGGVVVPAHIDRPSYSIISNLGMIPSNIPVKSLGISRFADFNCYSEQYNQYLILQSSDAHELGHIGICNRSLEIEEKSIDCILNRLKKGINVIQ